VRTPGGNLLWEPPGYLDDQFIEALADLGGVAAIAASHPHLTGLPVTLSEHVGNAAIYWAADDRRWIQRPDDRITLWSGVQEVLPGLTLVQCGGHFAGSAVLHWADGAGGDGVLMSGDTFLVGADRKTVSFMRSYPNLIPLSQRSIERIVGAIAPWPFDRLYSGFSPGLIDASASDAVRFSAERYIGWLRDDIRDPDERSRTSHS
jgi:glyoxylase-like metal-dependent hydrolase (beta-lactamase superfamily II)